MRTEFSQVGANQVMAALETQMQDIFTKLSQQGDLLLRCAQVHGLLVDNSTYKTPMDNFWKMPKLTDDDYAFLEKHNIISFRQVCPSNYHHSKTPPLRLFAGFTPFWDKVFTEVGEKMAPRVDLKVTPSQTPVLSLN